MSNWGDIREINVLYDRVRYLESCIEEWYYANQNLANQCKNLTDERNALRKKVDECEKIIAEKKKDAQNAIMARAQEIANNHNKRANQFILDAGAQRDAVSDEYAKYKVNAKKKENNLHEFMDKIKSELSGVKEKYQEAMRRLAAAEENNKKLLENYRECFHRYVAASYNATMYSAYVCLIVNDMEDKSCDGCFIFDENGNWTGKSNFDLAFSDVFIHVLKACDRNNREKIKISSCREEYFENWDMHVVPHIGEVIPFFPVNDMFSIK